MGAAAAAASYGLAVRVRHLVLLYRFRGYYQMVDPPINSTADKLEYEYTRDYWQIFFARMAFVIVFEVGDKLFV